MACNHFRDFVRRRIINVYPIDATQQLEDTFTKPLDAKAFLNLRKKIMGW